jgi:hypothetical protein
MKLTSLVALTLPLAAAGFSREQYASGEVMARMMEAKEVCSFFVLVVQN